VNRITSQSPRPPKGEEGGSTGLRREEPAGLPRTRAHVESLLPRPRGGKKRELSWESPDERGGGHVPLGILFTQRVGGLSHDSRGEKRKKKGKGIDLDGFRQKEKKGGLAGALRDPIERTCQGEGGRESRTYRGGEKKNLNPVKGLREEGSRARGGSAPRNRGEEKRG